MLGKDAKQASELEHLFFKSQLLSVLVELQKFENGAMCPESLQNVITKFRTQALKSLEE